MATKRRNTYIDMDLNWLRLKIEELKSYVDSNPITSLTDRVTSWKETRSGSVPFSVVTIEQQHKNIRDTLKDCALIAEAIAALSEIDAEKKTLTRGDIELTPFESGEI